MRRFGQRVELVGPSGDHVRFLPGPLASAMVQSGMAEVGHANGKVKSIKLLETAATHALRIGPPEGRCTGVRFTRRELLDESGSRVWAHHPRARNYE
jgi:hypothetical protein